MRDFRTHALTQLWAIGVLRDVTDTDIDSVTKVDYNLKLEIVLAIALALRRLPDEDSIQVSGCYALFTLGEKTMCRESIISQSAIVRHLMTAANAQSGYSKEIRTQMIYFMACLLDDNCAATLKAAGVLRDAGAIDLVLLAMKTQPGDEMYTLDGLKALRGLLKDCSGVQHVFDILKVTLASMDHLRV